MLAHGHFGNECRDTREGGIHSSLQRARAPEPGRLRTAGPPSSSQSLGAPPLGPRSPRVLEVLTALAQGEDCPAEMKIDLLPKD